MTRQSIARLPHDLEDVRVVILSFRSWALWVLGYPDAARADTLAALEHARKIGHAASLMYALFCAPWVFIQCGDYAAAKARSDELITLADEKGSLFWKAIGMRFRGCVLALTGQSAEAIQCFNSTITTYRSSGTTAGCRFGCHIWQKPMRTSAVSMTLGSAVAKR